jgi:aspartyl-tRNA(Asn)/glutamyl-tRNA(Gln) amidotransferase subunit A
MREAETTRMQPRLLTTLRETLGTGACSARALAEQALARIARMDPTLNAVARCHADEALAAADAADRRLRAGERGPMLGIPIALKDNLAQAGLPLGNGSRLHPGFRSPTSATVVARLLEAGAVPVARTNLDAFAMGSSGEHCAAGPARNPWAPDRVPGGSSSGSAVAVAAGYVPLALGSDTGGSVRLPAAFCGLTALRPSYGVLSRSGLTAMASSLDQVGLLAHSARDLAAGLSVMAGVDPLDSTSCALPGQERLASLGPASWKGLRVGMPAEYFREDIAPGVRSRLEEAIRQMEALGANLTEVSLPHALVALDAYGILNAAEAASNLARFDGVRFGTRLAGENLEAMISATRDEGFGEEVKRRILLGTFCLSRGHAEAFYARARKARTLVARDFQRAFEAVDLLVAPASPDTAFPFASRLDDPEAMHLADLFQVAPALAALPCLALPAGLVEGLPVGLQLIGPRLSDVRLLELASAFQDATGHHLLVPGP